MGAQDRDIALFAECKWTNEKVDLSVLEILAHAADCFLTKTYICTCFLHVKAFLACLTISTKKSVRMRTLSYHS